MHKNDKKRKLGINPQDHYFVDLHYHLGTRSGKSIDQLIDILETSADVIAITGRGIGWASTEPGGCEYTYARFLQDAKTSKKWNVKELGPAAALLNQNDRLVIIVDTQETVTSDNVEVLTFGPQKFHKYDSVADIVNQTDFSLLTHPFSHPCYYHFNEDNLEKLGENLKGVTAIEIYDQAFRHLYRGRANFRAMKLAQEMQKPGVTSSDSHNYLGLALETSGMVIPQTHLNWEKQGDVIVLLKKVIVEQNTPPENKIMHYQSGSLRDYLNYIKIVGRKDWNSVMWGF